MEDIAPLLSKVVVFSSFSKKELERINQDGEVCYLKKGEYLFNKGDKSEHLFVLVQGKIAILDYSLVLNKDQVVAHIKTGETIGELGAISGEERTLSAMSHAESIVFKLSKDLIDKWFKEKPQFQTAVMNCIIHRFQSTIQGENEGNDCVYALLPANKNINTNEFLKQLSQFSEHIKIITRETFIKQANNTNYHEIVTWLEKCIDNNIKVLLYNDTFEGFWLDACLHLSDQFIIIGDNTQEPFYSPELLKIIDSYHLYRKELVLINSTNSNRSNTSKWFAGIDYLKHYHIRDDSFPSFERFVRLITGQARALILSGGGGRGWVHIGALKAFKEYGIEFDLVGGTSAGAFVAAMYAAEKSLDEISESFGIIAKSIADSLSWTGYTIPICSLNNGVKPTKVIHNICNDIKIEELERLFFCLSSNITIFEQTIHNQGFLWKALRASASLPGLVPPVLYDGNVHIDGGIMNNFPVDVALELLMNKGKIDAVNLGNQQPEDIEYNVSANISTWKFILSKIGLMRERYTTPTLSKIIVDTMSAAAIRHSRKNILLVNNLLIMPNLSNYTMLGNSLIRDKAKLIEIGYTETVNEIEKALNKPRS